MRSTAAAADGARCPPSSRVEATSWLPTSTVTAPLPSIVHSQILSPAAVLGKRVTANWLEQPRYTWHFNSLLLGHRTKRPSAGFRCHSLTERNGRLRTRQRKRFRSCRFALTFRSLANFPITSADSTRPGSKRRQPRKRHLAFHLNDAFQFQRNIRVVEEQMGLQNGEDLIRRTNPLWSSTAFWYALPAQASGSD